MLTTAKPARAGSATRDTFGTLPDGRAVASVTLTNAAGAKAVVIAWGAALQQLWIPDRAGTLADVTLGCATLGDYIAHRDYFGATVGRFANRIAGGRFTLDGKSYASSVNSPPNTLHGGGEGFDRKLWKIVEIVGGGAPRVTLRLVSPAGDQGYPGTLSVTATYTLDDAGRLTIDYRATTSAPTIVNLTNHAYWNLAGEGTGGALGAVLTIPASRFTPVDATLIPTGEERAVAGTPFDFRTPRRIDERVRDTRDMQIALGHGYDHNFIVADDVTTEPHLSARLVEPGSGRTLEVWSNQPGLQFYSGNFLNATPPGKSGRAYRPGDAIALEPQLFPDTPNRPGFPSARLDPGQVYHHRIEFRFGVGPP